MTRFTKIAAGVLGAIALASCGGGGGDSVSPVQSAGISQVIAFGQMKKAAK